MRGRSIGKWPWWRRGGLLVLLGGLALNGLAWQQAWAMTHYAPSGAPPPTIEALSWPGKIRVLLLGLTVARPENAHTPRDLGLAYTTRRIATPDGGAVETWVIDQPQPRGVVLLFPGYASSKETLLAPADPRATTAQATAVYAALGGPKTLATFPGAGHDLLATTTLQDWHRTVAQFLARNDVAP